MQHLYLDGCDKVTDDGVNHVMNLTLLQHLDLRYCNNGITDYSLKHLKYLPSLQHLDLRYCSRITYDGLQRMNCLTSFQ